MIFFPAKKLRNAALVCGAFAFLVTAETAGAAEMEHWAVYTGPALAQDGAVAAAIEDLQKDGRRLGLEFEHSPEEPDRLGNVVLAGNASRNAVVERLTRDGTVRLADIGDPQGFEIQTHDVDGGRLIVVAGGSVLGDVYGLYWLWDRMRVFGHIPDVNETRKPVLRVRLTGAHTEEGVRNALRYTATWVSGPFVDRLMPWQAEAGENAANREQTEALAEYAHALHLKLLAVADEISYQPALLDEFGARLTPEDPALWQMLQAKYRRLFTALPELDGVQIRTGEHTRITGNCRPFDVMHEPPECDWPLEQRYRTFLQKMHEVVVDEFGKIYFHRTWVTNATEQHSDPEVYKRIFTENVPTKDLYLSPYLSKADRWYYQPYNPTFNLTPHNMLVLLSRLDYHAAGGVNVFPSFPGQYYQGGLERILAPEDCNVKGMHFGTPAEWEWDTDTLTAYTAFRLAWEPELDLKTIAWDFASIHLGSDAADETAEALLLSYTAYRDGLYIKPVAESLSWNTLPQLRLTTFEAKGFPIIDRGKAHIDWLRDNIYLPSKGHIEEALAHLDKGRAAAGEMEARFKAVADQASDPALARRVSDSLRLTRLLVETNNLYVRTCYDYFQYRETSTAQHRAALAKNLSSLKETCREFAESPGFQYQLFGIDVLIRCASEALADLDKAEAILAAAPGPQDVMRLIAETQAQHAAAVAALPNDAEPFMHWRGKVDGKDILTVKGDSLTIEHIQADPIQSDECRFLAPLPQQEGTVLVRDIESGKLHPFAIQQPSESNGYMFKLYFADPGRGYTWWEFELYFVPKAPSELGVAVPWQ